MWCDLEVRAKVNKKLPTYMKETKKAVMMMIKESGLSSDAFFTRLGTYVF